jgi:hypothetical protein
MVFNTTFNNISVITWWSVLLVEETGELHQELIRDEPWDEKLKMYKSMWCSQQTLFTR